MVSVSASPSKRCSASSSFPFGVLSRQEWSRSPPVGKYGGNMLDNITELRTFVRIVGAGSLSAASREMGLALSVVSKRLASLGLDVFCNTQVTFDTSVNNARSECARNRGVSAYHPIEEIRSGDVVWFPPGEKHWHGASPTTSMTHIALQVKLDGRNVDWMEKVTDEQYGQ